MTKKRMFIKSGIRKLLSALIVGSCFPDMIQGDVMSSKAPERFAGLDCGGLNAPTAKGCTLNFLIS